jgi:hypothetical protein
VLVCGDDMSVSCIRNPGHPTVDIASDDELLAPGQERVAGVLFALHTLWGKRQLTAVA